MREFTHRLHSLKYSRVRSSGHYNAHQITIKRNGPSLSWRRVKVHGVWRRILVGDVVETVVEQSLRITPRDRVPLDVEVRIDPAREPDWIGLGVAAGLRVVVAEVVVEEPGLGIAILAGQYPN